MKTCSALARRGHEVVLVAKRGEEVETDDIHAFYCVERSFEIENVARPKRRGGGLVYMAGTASQVVRRRSWADLVYCRDPIGALLASELRMPLVLEVHGVPTSPWLRGVVSRVAASPRTKGVVAITESLRQDLRTEGLVPNSCPIVVAPDACDPPTSTVRAGRGTPPMIGYVGNLYAGRGIETILELARRMPACKFQIVGGRTADLEKWRTQELPPNLELVGFRPQAELPAFYANFDVVLMPHAISGVVGATGTSDISRWTSPMKMFEYMASGVAMVATDLPVLREVLEHETNALLVPSSDLDAWQCAIQRLLDDNHLRTTIATRAQDQVRAHYTWDARMRTVSDELAL